MVDVINAKESYQLKKLKRHFLLRNDIPITTYNLNGKGFLQFEDDDDSHKTARKLEDDLISEKLQRTVTFENEL